MPRGARLLVVLVLLALVSATLIVWLTNTFREPVSQPPPEIRVKAESVDGISFEVEHEMKEGVNLFSMPAPHTLYLERRGDVLSYFHGLVTINDISMPDVKPGDTVRWNLEGPLLINGTAVEPHPFQPKPIEAPSIDGDWKPRESPTPRDTLSVAWAGGTRFLVAAHGDGAIRVWDVDKGEVKQTMVPDVPADPRARGGYGLRAAVSPNGKLIAATNVYGEVASIWDLEKGTKTAEFKEPKGRVIQVAFSDDKSFFEARGGKLLIRQLDQAMLDPLKSVGERFEEQFAIHAKTKAIAWHDDKKLTFGPSLLDAEFEWSPMSGGCLAFSADGSMLAAFNGDSRLAILDPKIGKEAKRLRWRGKLGIVDSINALAFAPDGKTLAVGCSDSIRLYDVPTGRERGGIPCPWVRSLAYSADGRTLAAGLRYQPGLRLWNTADLVVKKEP